MERRAISAISAALVVFLVGAMTAGGVLASPLDEGWDEPAEVAKVQWGLVSVDGPHSLTLAMSTGYCVGKKMPRLLRPHTTWRPGRVVITARMFFPALHFAPHEACAGVGLGMQRQFHFAHSLVGRSFYDGSTSPPEIREPSE